MKRAAIIVTSAAHVGWQRYDERVRAYGTLQVAELSEQLLADLLRVLDLNGSVEGWEAAAARVRAALGEA